MTGRGVVLLVICLLSFLGCAQSNPLQQKYGDDALYFRALLEAKGGNEKLCVRLLTEAQKKASPLVSRRAMEHLAQLQNVQDSVETRVKIYKRFPDEESLLQAAVELFDANEFSRVIELTEGLDLETCNNEIAYYRIQALGKDDDSNFERELFEWGVNRPFSTFHYKIYCDLSSFPDLHEEKRKLLELRADVFAKNYAKAYLEAKAILADDKFFIPEILNDAGKALLYGSTTFQTNALWFDSIKNNLPQDCKFYASFYAGRLYDKADTNRDRAQNRFQMALEETREGKNFDSALWYYLNSLLKTSIFRTTSAVEKYAGQWEDPSYFDDFFETLLLRLLSLHAWQELLRVTELIGGKASFEIQAKYSFITARLIEEKFIRMSAQETKEKTQTLYKRALESGSDLYYCFSAMNKLKLSDQEIERIVFALGKRKVADRSKSADGIEEADEDDQVLAVDGSAADVSVDISLDSSSEKEKDKAQGDADDANEAQTKDENDAIGVEGAEDENVIEQEDESDEKAGITQSAQAGDTESKAEASSADLAEWQDDANRTDETQEAEGSKGKSKLRSDTVVGTAYAAFLPTNEAERLLMGYADFGLGEFILDEYKRLETQVGNRCAARVAFFLDQYGLKEESIRMASSRVFFSNDEVPRELLQMAFPRRFQDDVETCCRDFSQPDYLLYALIRSESFFNESVVSSAGAKGLTQLMDTTAADVARKLKVEEYDLNDGSVNIRFGSFYLEELRRRLDSSILAILSYNAGISRVRSWVKSADLSFQTKALSHDLLLEALPFSETREYGRKVVSAAAMYAFLYNGISPNEIIEEMMK